MTAVFCGKYILVIKAIKCYNIKGIQLLYRDARLTRAAPDKGVLIQFKCGSDKKMMVLCPFLFLKANISEHE